MYSHTVYVVPVNDGSLGYNIMQCWNFQFCLERCTFYITKGTADPGIMCLHAQAMEITQTMQFWHGPCGEEEFSLLLSISLAMHLATSGHF